MKIKFESEIIIEGYLKGYDDSVNDKSYNKFDDGGWNIIDQWCYREGYRKGYKEGQKEIEILNRNKVGVLEWLVSLGIT